MLSVIIPTLNAARVLRPALDQFRHAQENGLVGEIIVSDGGSTDETLELAHGSGIKHITGSAGRGTQLARAARSAGEPWLLFLHADTRLDAGWENEVRAFISDPASSRRAGVFRFQLDDTAAAARRLAWLVDRRARWLGLPYGDQGLLISRDFYTALGGYRDVPIMEDVMFIRRVGRARLVFFETAAITSAERYLASGYLARSVRNLWCLALYFLGVAPARIARIYR